MERSKILEKLKFIVDDRLGIYYDVTDEASFNDDLGFDSLDNVEFIMECEKVFEITISDDDIQNVKTVSDALDYLEANIED